ncbi:MAG: DUF1697 domain-containing protein [Oscillospiraceae bacterium]|nr:DUF1697 domain-containing protein [Oscillospiraceae bacterium]
MSDVCDVFSRAGMSDVISALASGNIIFRSAHSQNKLRKILEQAMAKYYGGQISLFVKNAGEIKTMIKSAPFVKNAKFHVYAFICEAGFEDTLINEFRGVAAAPDEDAKIRGGVFYWQCAKGATLDSGFSKILGRKDMKDKFTSRNIGTIEKITAKFGM